MCSLSLVPVLVRIQNVVLFFLLCVNFFDSGSSECSCVQGLRGALLRGDLCSYCTAAHLAWCNLLHSRGRRKKALLKYPHEPEIKSPPLVGLIWQYPNMGTNLFRSKRKFLP